MNITLLWLILLLHSWFTNFFFSQLFSFVQNVLYSIYNYGNCDCNYHYNPYSSYFLEQNLCLLIITGSFNGRNIYVLVLKLSECLGFLLLENCNWYIIYKGTVYCAIENPLQIWRTNELVYQIGWAWIKIT